MIRPFVLAAVAAISLSPSFDALAHDLKSAKKADIPASFDILSAGAKAKGKIVTFSMTVAGTAGADKPQPTGKLPGASVHAYVWPTTLDPEVAGFSKGSGILALAVTAHPDFDDTPLIDENGDGDPNNDGANWHSHWVVLAKDPACGPAGLKVRDISAGEDLAVPPTAPGLPLMLDSPGASPLIKGSQLSVSSALRDGKPLVGAGFDAVTSKLTVNKEAKAPLLCVTEVFDIASGTLDLSGKIVEGK